MKEVPIQKNNSFWDTYGTSISLRHDVPSRNKRLSAIMSQNKQCDYHPSLHHLPGKATTTTTTPAFIQFGSEKEGLKIVNAIVCPTLDDDPHERPQKKLHSHRTEIYAAMDDSRANTDLSKNVAPSDPTSMKNRRKSINREDAYSIQVGKVNHNQHSRIASEKCLLDLQSADHLNPIDFSTDIKIKRRTFHRSSIDASVKNEVVVPNRIGGTTNDQHLQHISMQQQQQERSHHMKAPKSVFIAIDRLQLSFEYLNNVLLELSLGDACLISSLNFVKDFYISNNLLAFPYVHEDAVVRVVIWKYHRKWSLRSTTHRDDAFDCLGCTPPRRLQKEKVVAECDFIVPTTSVLCRREGVQFLSSPKDLRSVGSISIKMNFVPNVTDESTLINKEVTIDPESNMFIVDLSQPISKDETKFLELAAASLSSPAQPSYPNNECFQSVIGVPQATTIGTSLPNSGTQIRKASFFHNDLPQLSSRSQTDRRIGGRLRGQSPREGELLLSGLPHHNPHRLAQEFERGDQTDSIIAFEGNRLSHLQPIMSLKKHIMSVSSVAPCHENPNSCFNRKLIENEVNHHKTFKSSPTSKEALSQMSSTGPPLNFLSRLLSGTHYLEKLSRKSNQFSRANTKTSNRKGVKYQRLRICLKKLLLTHQLVVDSNQEIKATQLTRGKHAYVLASKSRQILKDVDCRVSYCHHQLTSQDPCRNVPCIFVFPYDSEAANVEDISIDLLKTSDVSATSVVLATAKCSTQSTAKKKLNRMQSLRNIGPDPLQGKEGTYQLRIKDSSVVGEVVVGLTFEDTFTDRPVQPYII